MKRLILEYWLARYFGLTKEIRWFGDGIVICGKIL